MKQILLFGAGKSATVLIEYLASQAPAENWHLTVADANLALAQSKIGDALHASAVSFDINDSARREQQVAGSDLVISMLPAALHFLVAQDCVQHAKPLLTASYVDDAIRSLQDQVEQKGILFLCEMGLDPGIDHMSAMQIIDGIRLRGGSVTSFCSHCGGLVAPESDDNPWHYKISWNPRNIILAGKAGAHFRENGKEIRLPYEKLFNSERAVEVPGQGVFGWYPNRDSLSYAPLYGLEDAATFIRTTLRHPDFMYGWNNIIELKLTDESPVYDTDGKSLASLFKEHLDRHDFGNWLSRKMSSHLQDTKWMLENLSKLAEAEQEAEDQGEKMPGSFLTANAAGELEEVGVGDMKVKGAAYVAHRMHEANLTLKQLVFLGLDDRETLVNKGKCSAADILQFAAERKLALQPGDKDMIIMLHEFEYVLDHKKKKVQSSLVVKGEDSRRTAMAKTVGLPLGIAAKHILNGRIRLKGLHIPTRAEIYEPVLKELAGYGVRFVETVSE